MPDDNIAKEWPPVRGDYTVIDPHSRICVATLASDMDPFPGACMVGSCKTENLGIEKIIINTISNSNIRYILICGNESRGHLSGNTLIAIHHNGIDGQGRIIGSDGAIPFIENIPAEAVERFMCQVDLIDMRGLVETNKIMQLIDEYRSKGIPFPERPMVIKTRKKKQKIEREITGGDMIIAPGILMDSTSGIIFTET
jgi:tetrahydromethanopterin S-methyltransferase subunit A